MSDEKKYAGLAKLILQHIGGPSNVADYTHCMTRLRITPVNRKKTDIDSIKALEGVIGVVEVIGAVDIYVDSAQGTGKYVFMFRHIRQYIRYFNLLSQH